MSKANRRRERNAATLLLMGFTRTPAPGEISLDKVSGWWRYGAMKGGVRPTRRGILMGPTFLDEISGGEISPEHAERVTVELKEFVSLWGVYLEKQSGS